MRNSLFHREVPPKVPAKFSVMDANVDAKEIVYRHRAGIAGAGSQPGSHRIDGYAAPVTFDGYTTRATKSVTPHHRL
jgi:hypothetical protein